MVGPALSAFTIISAFYSSLMKKNSVILFLRIGVLRKSGKLARFTIIFPAKLGSDTLSNLET